MRCLHVNMIFSNIYNSFHCIISIIFFFNTEESLRECSNYQLNQVVILISVTFTLTVIVKHYKPNLCRWGRVLFFLTIYTFPPCPQPPSPQINQFKSRRETITCSRFNDRDAVVSFKFHFFPFFQTLKQLSQKVSIAGSTVSTPMQSAPQTAEGPGYITLEVGLVL